MAFLRYANARVTQPYVRDWDRVRVASGTVRAGRDIADQASKILKADFDPKKYLLTHATIVASVDTKKVPKAKLGSSTENGKKIVRKTLSFNVLPESDKYINNNHDCWSRPVLLKSYKTFVGAHSFVEHVQIEKLSKGRIIDAVARDVGDSIYVDILVANDRKHEELCSKIESGELSTLSMGCSIDGSTCTKCGHWAADETEFCDHVRYMKGNYFYDEDGVRRRVAELCGDESLDPTGGVQFVEGSWVKLPAFEGAVARGVLDISTDSDKKKVANKIESGFSRPLPVIGAGYQKAARDLSAFGEEEEESGGESMAPVPEVEESPLGKIREDLKRVVLDGVKDELETELTRKRVEDQVLPPSDAPNDTIVKQARLQGMKLAYRASLRSFTLSARSEADFLDRVASLNEQFGISVPVSVYRAALRVGTRDSYPNLSEFLKAAGEFLGRPASNEEAVTLVRLASLLEGFQTARRTADQKRSR